MNDPPPTSLPATSPATGTAPGAPVSSARLLAEAARRAPIRDRIHLLAAMLFLFTLPLGTSLSAITFSILLVTTLIHLPRNRASLVSVRNTPWMWMFILWPAWCLVTLLWSLDSGHGLGELSSLRMLLVPLMLTPVMDRAPRLVAAFLVGVLLANVVQTLHVLDISEAFRHGFGFREGGLLHAVHTGMFCGVSVCWCLAIVVNGKTSWRWAALGMGLLALAGLIVTGSRGPWIAVAIAVPAQLVIMILRRPQRRRHILGIVVLGIVSAASMLGLARGFVAQRIDDARTEFRAAMDDEDYRTSTGLRIGLWRWAWDSFRENPLGGHGVGSFEVVMTQQPSYRRAAERWPESAAYMRRDHAHSTYLHLLSGTGVIGAALFVGVLLTTFLASWRCPWGHAFIDGLPGAALVWAISAQFDALHLGGHTFGMLMFTVALAAHSLVHPDPERAS